jgi:hypothetical protein
MFYCVFAGDVSGHAMLYCFTAAVLLLYCCFTAALLMLYCVFAGS